MSKSLSLPGVLSVTALLMAASLSPALPGDDRESLSPPGFSRQMIPRLGLPSERRLGLPASNYDEDFRRDLRHARRVAWLENHQEFLRGWASPYRAGTTSSNGASWCA